jgi:hypothetical protein
MNHPTRDPHRRGETASIPVSPFRVGSAQFFQVRHGTLHLIVELPDDLRMHICERELVRWVVPPRLHEVLDEGRRLCTAPSGLTTSLPHTRSDYSRPDYVSTAIYIGFGLFRARPSRIVPPCRPLMAADARASA